MTMSMKGVTNGQTRFAVTPKAEIPRSKFQRSFGVKTTFDAGNLIPVFVDEVLPGDTFNLRMTAFARLSTPLEPIMDNLYLDTHFFFVPNRLVWDNWERFNGAQDNPTSSTFYLMPTTTSPAGGYAVGSLYDYFGIPTQVAGLAHNNLPIRAYSLIWNTWFRDENLQNPAVVSTNDGPDTSTSYIVRRRGKRHDYFTSCLPWPQKGPTVNLPLGISAPVISTNQNILLRSAVSTPTTDRQMLIGNVGGVATNVFTDGGGAGTGENARFGSQTGLQADLTAATAATINQLRQAFQIQRIYERDARGGTRYTEILKSHFGVISPDARLQRPEYLGGGTSPININPIAQTSATNAQPTPQGNLAAIGTGVINGHGFTKSFVEHGYVIGLVSARADLNYQQGLARMWSRSTRFDFYWPALAHLGEQAVLNKEIYAQGTSVDNDVFGYQERFAEYRYKPSMITGQFRSTFAQTLDSWHLAERFTSLPLLNTTFIQSNPPIARVVAVPSFPHFLMDAYFDYICARPMPTFSVPGLIDHF